MILDDDPDIRDLLEVILGDIYRTESAKSVSDVLERDDISTFDLIITDYLTEDLPCVELISRYPEQKYLVITAYSSSTPDLANVLHSENVDYLRKPFDISELQSRIELLLGTQ